MNIKKEREKMGFAPKDCPKCGHTMGADDQGYFCLDQVSCFHEENRE